MTIYMARELLMAPLPYPPAPGLGLLFPTDILGRQSPVMLEAKYA